MRALRWTVVAISALGATACEQVESKNVRTDGIYADFEAVARGDGYTELQANLRVGGRHSNTYLDLVEGDRLEVHHGLSIRDMDRDGDLFGAIRYRARFDTEAEGATFRVAFLREPHDPNEAECRGESAPDSIAVLPAPFEAEIPGDGRFSRARDDLVLRWSPPGEGRIEVALRGTCIETYRDVVDDDGRLEIDDGDIEPVDGELGDDACDVDVTLTRVREGRVDRAFGEGGKFVARQVRTVRFTSVP